MRVANTADYRAAAVPLHCETTTSYLQESYCAAFFVPDLEVLDKLSTANTALAAAVPLLCEAITTHLGHCAHYRSYRNTMYCTHWSKILCKYMYLLVPILLLTLNTDVHSTAHSGALQTGSAGVLSSLRCPHSTECEGTGDHLTTSGGGSWGRDVSRPCPLEHWTATHCTR